MTPTEILHAVQDVFREVFSDDALVIKPETTAADIDEWDSFNHMNLIVTIEKKFRIKFSLSELQKLATVGDMLSLVEKKTKAG